MSELKPGGAPVFDAARHLDALAPALGLTIGAGQRPGVLQFLATAHAMAELVATAPFEEGACELAPVFRPGLPGESA
jgi:hypothetical protein